VASHKETVLLLSKGVGVVDKENSLSPLSRKALSPMGAKERSFGPQPSPLRQQIGA
jgi:hypothetical protein